MRREHANGYGILSASVIILLLVLLACTAPVSGMVDPSAAYCIALGYKYTIESTAEGERGLCQLPNGETVDAWQFLQGKVAQQWSYCKKNGYEMKTVSDSQKCLIFLTEECAVCVLADGREVEVTELMGLTFEETTCGDGTCGIPENFGTCPADCPSGGWDGYCDAVKDGIVDPDCEEGSQDPDYGTNLAVSFDPAQVDISTMPPDTATVTATVTPDGVGKAVSLSYCKGSSAGPWTQIGQGTTDDAGEFSVEWTPPETGTYYFRAEMTDPAVTVTSDPASLLVVPEFPFSLTPILLIASLATVSVLSRKPRGRSALVL